MPGGPDLHTVENDGVTVVSFRDASILDLSTIQEIAKQLYALAGQTGRRGMILDLEQVKFLSSQSLGVLLTLRRKLDRQGVRFALSGVQPDLRQVFAITNLDKLFAFYPTVDDALKAIATPA